jgi:hypothetical protein
MYPRQIHHSHDNLINFPATFLIILRATRAQQIVFRDFYGALFSLLTILSSVCHQSLLFCVHYQLSPFTLYFLQCIISCCSLLFTITLYFHRCITSCCSSFLCTINVLSITCTFSYVFYHLLLLPVFTFPHVPINRSLQTFHLFYCFLSYTFATTIPMYSTCIPVSNTICHIMSLSFLICYVISHHPDSFAQKTDSSLQ